MKYDKIILITGGAGFIGSHVVEHFVRKYPNYLIVNIDKLTYASNIEENLKSINNDPLVTNYVFVKGDICDRNLIEQIFKDYKVSDVIHLAAESHVDNSIKDPSVFVKTNVIGTYTLLDVCREFWKDNYDLHRFHHVSTDEVYGALDNNPEHKFHEYTAYNPHSPYSASKASSDHFVKAYHDTYGLNVTISNCSNNYGPHQHNEKLIPHVIHCLMNNEKIPIYGLGINIRDWLYVEDHVRAIDDIFHNGTSGETYNVGGNNELTNNDLIKMIVKVYSKLTHQESTIDFKNVVKYVVDRKGHDLRYAIDSSKLQNELNWKPTMDFEKNLKNTILYYMNHNK